MDFAVFDKSASRYDIFYLNDYDRRDMRKEKSGSFFRESTKR